MSPNKRRHIWERDGGVCGICKEPVAFDRFMDIDHVNPSSLGGDGADENLQASHKRCNVKKGGRNRVDPLAYTGLPRIPTYRLWDNVPPEHRRQEQHASPNQSTCDAAVRWGTSVTNSYMKCQLGVKDGRRFCKKHRVLQVGSLTELIEYVPEAE